MYSVPYVPARLISPVFAASFLGRHTHNSQVTIVIESSMRVSHSEEMMREHRKLNLNELKGDTEFVVSKICSRRIRSLAQARGLIQRSCRAT